MATASVDDIFNAIGTDGFDELIDGVLGSLPEAAIDLSLIQDQLKINSGTITQIQTNKKQQSQQALQLATASNPAALGDKFSPLAGSVLDLIPKRITGKGRLR